MINEKKLANIKKVADFLRDNAEALATFGGEMLELKISLTGEKANVEVNTSLDLNNKPFAPVKFNHTIKAEKEEVKEEEDTRSFMERLKDIEPILEDMGCLANDKNDPNYQWSECMYRPSNKTKKDKKGEDQRTVKRTVFFMKQEDMKTFIELMNDNPAVKEPSKACLRMAGETNPYTIKSSKTNNKIREFGYMYKVEFRMFHKDFVRCCQDFGLRKVDDEMRKVVQTTSARVF